VTFTSWADRTPGSWANILITAQCPSHEICPDGGTAGSELTWTTVQYAGGADDILLDAGIIYPGAIVVYGDVDTEVSLNHVTVEQNGGSGFVFAGRGARPAAGSANLTASDWADASYPVVIDPNQAGSLPNSLAVGADSGAGLVALACQGLLRDCGMPMTVDHSQTWPALPILYAIVTVAGVNVDGDVDGGGATLTIAAPNTLEFVDQSTLQIDGLATGEGQLVAVGDPSNPIAFVGANPDGGVSWQGISLSYPAANGNPYGGTELAYCDVENAGLGTGATSLTGEITIQAGNYNLATNGLALGPSITNCQFSTYESCGILGEYIGNSASYGTIDAGANGDTFEGGPFDVCTSSPPQ
jgi:hypothetical protein